MLFLILFVASRSERIRMKTGMQAGIFFIGYAVARGLVELVRQPRRPSRSPVGWCDNGPASLRPCVTVGPVSRDSRSKGCVTNLNRILYELIERDGPITVAEYMELALSHPEHGYYTTREPFGASGDFTTAPEVSQMFGELIGLWLGVAWRNMGRPDSVHLIELAPGRGTLMRDVLRAAKGVSGFCQAISVTLVEISDRLIEVQQETLRGAEISIQWQTAPDPLPVGPLPDRRQRVYRCAAGLAVCQGGKRMAGASGRVGR